MNTTVKLFHKYCSCHNRLAIIQEKYENYVKDLFDKGELPLNECQLAAIAHFGFSKMCCRNNILNAPTYFIVDTYYGAVTVEGVVSKDLVTMNGVDTSFNRPVPDLPVI